MLPEEILIRIFSHLDTSDLRQVSTADRRFNDLLLKTPCFWKHTTVPLSARKGRGRDRRQSYATPCGVSTDQLAIWLDRRSACIETLHVKLLYPDALSAFAEVLVHLERRRTLTNNNSNSQAGLTEVLKHLELHGQCSQWPLCPFDFSFLTKFRSLESLKLIECANDMLAVQQIPSTLKTLEIDKVCHYDPDDDDAGGWDTLPPCLTAPSMELAKNLTGLVLGSCRAEEYLTMEEEVKEFAKLKALVNLETVHIKGNVRCMWVKGGG